jgi:hypothetical protein
LDEVATAAEEVADDQRRIAQQAREMRSQRDRGWSWSRILEQQPAPGIFELVRRSRSRMTAAVTALARGLAGGLAAEGATRRQIARHLGVSHQRVTAILNRGRPTESDEP